ncbi:MAG: hypothetical protein LBV30_10870 [Propionibacteriaceae bacterium]|jgi:hypothetical protein|nr:hypothetical protein [Propionibacteriaceae bacterium]
MENNIGGVSASEATVALNSLSTDGDRLVRQVRIPWASLAGLGACGGWYVANSLATTPGASYLPSGTGWIPVVGFFVILYLAQRDTGIHFRAMGVPANIALLGLLVLLWGLYSVSLGLIAFNLRWAVVITSVAAFVATTGLAGLAWRSAMRRLRHG